MIKAKKNPVIPAIKEKKAETIHHTKGLLILGRINLLFMVIKEKEKRARQKPKIAPLIIPSIKDKLRLS